MTKSPARSCSARKREAALFVGSSHRPITGHALRAGCAGSAPIERRERQSSALRELKIGRIIDREPVPIGQIGRCRAKLAPWLSGSTSIGNVSRLAKSTISKCRIDPLAPDRHLKAVGDLEAPDAPERQRPRAETRSRTASSAARSLRPRNTTRGHRAIEHEAQGRPSLIKSLIFSPPRRHALPHLSDVPHRFVGSLLVDRCASGTSRATGLPRRVMTISSPFSTRSSRRPRACSWPQRPRLGASRRAPVS